ncbi:MAG TPA: hypothetical protein PKY97_05210, partial [Saprospiraceae bacterium]|nr:hypothetical protein [Saprospiraceae bacterium]
MQYLKTIIDDKVFEFFNDWKGIETVTVNGREVSKKGSMWGTEHFFAIQEDGKEVKYLVRSRVSAELQVLLDIFRNGIPVKESLIVNYGGKEENPYKKKGIRLLKEYKLDDAIAQLELAEASDAHDAMIPLYKACIYSIKEDTVNGYKCIHASVKKGLPDLNLIDTLDDLAYLRIQPAFEAFKGSGYNQL